MVVTTLEKTMILVVLTKVIIMREIKIMFIKKKQR